ncbi:MAG TPA: TOMM precursor leader peptide-binding protein [Ornithinimicrobium sp.]|nr:TOMM precursor leader peptide-binding protein [Ornithinimicrobium sp.]
MTDTSRDLGQTRLAAAAGLEIVPVDDGLVLATAVSTMRLEGGVASFVRDRLLPALESRPTRQGLWDRWPELPRDEAGRVLDRLVDSGVVIELAPGATDGTVDGIKDGTTAWTTLVSTDLGSRQRLEERLASLRVLVLGGDVGVAAVGRALADAGMGGVVPAFPDAGGPPGRGGGLVYPLTRPGVAELVRDRDLVVVLTEPSLAAVRVWANEAGLAEDVPVLHVAVDGTGADLGPLVLPGEGPCYLCWRMRALACEDDFAVAMAREESRDGTRGAAAVPRPVLPGLVETVAGRVTQEVLALVAGIGPLTLAHHVLRVDALTGEARRHRVLPRPDCPACSKKDRPPQAAPSLAELLAEPVRSTPFDAIAEAVVGPVAGLVRRLDRVPKDVTEPELPLVVRAELANARFQPDDGFVTCSGKGVRATAARDTALGEALERYASLMWDPPRRFRGAAPDVPGRHLDPHELVLFDPGQYATLPFAPYSPGTVLDWVPARSLGSGDEVWVPLLAAHLGYDVPTHAEYLFPATSNGFAAGSGLATAVESALLEVVERDAFLVSWFHRLVTPRMDARTVPDEDTRAVAAAYARRGVEVEVHVLPTDSLVTVCLAVAWADEAPAAVVGLGAARDPVEAARKAVLEVAQVRPALRARLRDAATQERMTQLVADPALVHELEDHDLLYADPGTARSGLDHWRQGSVAPWEAPPGDPPDLAQLVASVVEVAGDVLYLDVTTAEVDALGVKVARVLVPGFQPIHFGADQARLGHQRLLRVPAELGLREARPTLAELNHLPHPLS